MCRQRDQFLWFREIQRDLGEGHVEVRGAGPMLMLSGYSYLGLGGHPEIEDACHRALTDYGTGTYGSRWLAGHTSLHEALETELADLHGREDAVVFSSGYVTNTTVLSALLQPRDTVLSDRLNHASILDGCRYSGATLRRFKHGNVDHLEEILSEASGRKMVVVDGVFSMRGDVAPLPALRRVCERHNALLLIDECHSHFVLGSRGGGLHEHFGLTPNDDTLETGTLSKVIPSNGGYVVGTRDICTFLRRSARGFVYSGSTSPVLTAASLAALRVLRRELPQRLRRLNDNRSTFTTALEKEGLTYTPTDSPVIAVHVGPAVTAVEAAAYCHRHGVLIHPVLPPVVPARHSILRVGLMATHTPSALVNAASVIADAIHHAQDVVTPDEAAFM